MVTGVLKNLLQHTGSRKHPGRYEHHRHSLAYCTVPPRDKQQSCTERRGCGGTFTFTIVLYLLRLDWIRVISVVR
ncbi:hypothetical protein E2C01_098446 [Portunus trituberculatus]|uniref:Uncharacterized protein n=1 Tax=Portunus trituberculatus TaxID=210409 RepID=A0A5B7K707_PORTR|nr:hypothetical protein [Portunus trituberculatus]